MIRVAAGVWFVIHVAALIWSFAWHSAPVPFLTLLMVDGLGAIAFLGFTLGTARK